MSDPDVIVVGCGPVGAMTALRASQHGLSVTVIDASTEIYPLPRAIGLDAEGQRLFHTAGLGDELAACSSSMGGAEFLNADGERVVGFDLPDGFRTPLGHTPMVSFEQPRLEEALRSRAEAAGARLRLGVEATGLASGDDGVRLETTAGQMSARWLVGADGARSWVRATLDIALEDQGFDQPWLVVDTWNVDPDLELPRMAQQHCNPDRVVTTVPGHEKRRRWEFQLAEHEDREEMLKPERIAELLAPWGTPEQLRIDRAAVYRFHGLVAADFRRGPVFLAGDSAHQMPPFQGQGMNSGLRDADNLAWKLAMVHRDAAGEALLDTYRVERKPHAEAIVEHSCDTGRLIDAIAAGIDLSTDAGYGGGRPFPHLEHGFLLAGHPAVGKPMPQPDIEGTPLDRLMGDGFALVAAEPFDVPSKAAWLDPQVVVAPADAFPHDLIGNGRVVIVRPDRYVAAVADDLAAAGARLAEIAGTQSLPGG